MCLYSYFRHVAVDKMSKNINIICKIISFVLVFSFTGLFCDPYVANAQVKECYPCVTLANVMTVQFDMEFESIPSTDDDKVYLYELWPFEYEIDSEMVPIDSARAKRRVRFKFDYTNDRLYKKYVLAGYIGGKLKNLCKPQYIINPELLAGDSKPRKERYEFCTQTKGMANIPLTGKGGIYVTANTMQVLNSRRSNVVTHPLARRGVDDEFPLDDEYYFMLNAAEPEGIRTVTNELAWYARNTAVQDFIIGNEVSNRMWNNMAYIPWRDFVREYINLYRVSYNAIKSVNKNARVYISLDGNWNRNREPDHWEYHTYIDSKDFLDIFNATIRAEGNIDWSLSIHPYIVPCDYAKFWDYSEHPDGDYMIEQIEEKKMYSFQNMTMVTDYMLQDRFLNPEGKVRDIIINELGVDRTQGDDIQAASICAAYVAYKRNPYITQFMYVDTVGYGVDLRLKGQAYRAFNALGTSKEQQYIDWALEYIGADSWDDILDLYPEDYKPINMK